MANLTSRQVAQLAYQAGWRGRDLVIAVAVAKGENRSHNESLSYCGNSNGTCDWGIWQLNDGAHNLTQAQKTQGLANAHRAYAVWKRRGEWDTDPWKAWAVYNSGIYLRYLYDAAIASDGISGVVSEKGCPNN